MVSFHPVSFGAGGITGPVKFAPPCVVPRLLSYAQIDDVVRVPERAAVRACRQLFQRHRILAGASTGSVFAAIQTCFGARRGDRVERPHGPVGNLLQEVVDHLLPDALRHAADLAQHLLDRLVLQGSAGHGRVEVIDVGLVMLAVVDLHRLLVDVRFERIEWIGKRGERVSHRTSSLTSRSSCLQPEDRTSMEALAQPAQSFPGGFVFRV